MEDWQNGNALVSKTSGVTPLQVRILHPPLVISRIIHNPNFKMFKFLKKEEPKDIKEILKGFRSLEEKFENLSQELGRLKDAQKKSIQKAELIRFNPFKEVGGDQSFSLALLNEDNDGVVLTSLYTRQDNRVYGKTIKKGVSEYSLSNEEKEVIEKAKGSDRETNGKK